MDAVGTCPDGNWFMEHCFVALRVIRVSKPEVCPLCCCGYSFTRLLLCEPGRGDAEEADEHGREIARLCFLFIGEDGLIYFAGGQIEVSLDFRQARTLKWTLLHTLGIGKCF